MTEYIPLVQSIAARFPGDAEAESEGYLVLCELAAKGPIIEAHLIRAVKCQLMDRRKRRCLEHRRGLAGGAADLDALPTETLDDLPDSDRVDVQVMVARLAYGQTWEEIAESVFPGRGVESVRREWGPVIAETVEGARRATAA